MINELRERLINIETKVNVLLDVNASGNTSTGQEKSYGGHADQAFGHVTYSQHGEDMILANIFHMLGNKQPSYLDIGAHHPFNISNTAFFYERGSCGVNIEANPNLVSAFTQFRPRDKNVNVGVSTSAGTLDFYFIDDFSGRNTFDRESAYAFVEAYPQFKISKVVNIPVITINEAVDKYCDGVFPDILTLDIEGLDLPVLKSADFSKNKPAVICVETVSAANSDNMADTREVLNSKGYDLYTKTIGNGIFVNRDLAPNFT